MEGDTRNWMANKWRFLRPDELDDIHSNFGWDAHFYSGGDPEGPVYDGRDELLRFLEGKKIECPESSPAFQTLRPLFHDAHLEYLSRSQDIVAGKEVREHDILFRDVHSHSQVSEERQNYTVNDLISNKEKANEDLKRSPKTLIAFKHGARLMREVLGGNRLLSSITRADTDEMFRVMREIPLNTSQRYKGMTFSQAIEAARKAGDASKPAQNTNWATYTQILAAFRMAVDDKLMSENPVSNRRYREMFKKERGKPREQFRADELNRLFRAPLYIGCKNDEGGYFLPGSNHPRRGRFWVPLLALFHGMRNNEACQIYTEDVKEEGGISYFAIREDLEHDQASEKKLKTKQSVRNVPIHPELQKMGFLDFVAMRRRDVKSPRLFPELREQGISPAVAGIWHGGKASKPSER